MRASIVVGLVFLASGCGGASGPDGSSSAANATAAPDRPTKPIAACTHFANGGSASLKLQAPDALVWTFDAVSEPPNKEQRTPIVAATKTAPGDADAYHVEIANGLDFEVFFSSKASSSPALFAGAAGDDCPAGAFSADRAELDKLVAALATKRETIGACALDPGQGRRGQTPQPLAITLQRGLDPATAILTGSSPDSDSEFVYLARSVTKQGDTRTIAGVGAAVFFAAGRHEDPLAKFVVHTTGQTSLVETGSRVIDPSLTKCTVDWQKVADALKASW
jgi:hypothetical protein